MWASMLYLAPVATILCKYELAEEEEFRGQLQDELIRVFEKTVSLDNLRLIPNKNLHATINTTYPAHSNLWTIMDGILQRYHLILDIKPMKNREGITIQLLEGPSWKKRI